MLYEVITKSYSETPTWPYKRLAGLGQVKRNDIVVFNFPAGDTVPLYVNNPDIYINSFNLGIDQISRNSNLMPKQPFTSAYERNHYFRSIGRQVIDQNINSFGEVVYRPVDRRDNYVKRCVAVAGETLEIRSNRVS